MLCPNTEYKAVIIAAPIPLKHGRKLFLSTPGLGGEIAVEGEEVRLPVKGEKDHEPFETVGMD